MSSCDPEKPCNNHNQRNRRGGKTCRSRYTLTRMGLSLSVHREMICKGCLLFVNSRGEGFYFV